MVVTRVLACVIGQQQSLIFFVTFAAILYHGNTAEVTTDDAGIETNLTRVNNLLNARL